MYFSIPLAQHVMEQLLKPSVENTFLIMNIRPFYSGSVSEKIKLKNRYPWYTFGPHVFLNVM